MIPAIGYPGQMDELNAASLTESLTHRPAPVLTWFSPPGEVGGTSAAALPRERIELSGPVARRWIAKTDNFLAAEFPFPADAFTTYFSSPHWREPLWIVTCWLRGLRRLSPQEAQRVDLAVSSDIDVLEEMRDELGLDVLVAQTTDSLALSWPTDLPFGITDGVADVMSHGDFVEDPHTPAADTVILNQDGLNDAMLRSVRSPGERDGEEHGAERARPSGGRALRLAELMSSSLLPSGLTLDEGERVVVTTNDAALFSAQLVQLWLSGAAVIWVPGGAGAQEIAAAEGATLVLGPRGTAA